MSNRTENTVNGAAESQKSILRAEGFSCPSCVTKIEKQLSAMDGVHSVKVSFATSKIEVEHAPTTQVSALVEQVAKAGYKARPSAF